jgi:hypothetical protein
MKTHCSRRGYFGRNDSVKIGSAAVPVAAAGVPPTACGPTTLNQMVPGCRKEKFSTGDQKPRTRSPQHPSRQPFLTHRLVCTLLFIVAFSILLQSKAMSVFTFTDTSGGIATGTLYLADSLNTPQTPLPGSTFHLTGEPNEASVNLSDANFEWLGGDLESTVSGSQNNVGLTSPTSDLVAYVSFSLSSAAFPAQDYSYQGAWGPPATFSGVWQQVAVPEPPTTALLICLSLTGLGLAARRVKPRSKQTIAHSSH